MVWSAAERIDVMARMIPQYQLVRIGHGEDIPLGRIVGQEPVEVRTPAIRAACGGECQR